MNFLGRLVMAGQIGLSRYMIGSQCGLAYLLPSYCATETAYNLSGLG